MFKSKVSPVSDLSERKINVLHFLVYLLVFSSFVLMKSKEKYYKHLMKTTLEKSIQDESSDNSAVMVSAY